MKNVCSLLWMKIAQWRKENDILKSQLDAAVSINGKLHEENARLEAECKKRE
jgi:hypothetical protein